MKNNRDMVYGNYNMGAYTEPQFIPPSGYNVNTSYQMYGANIMPNDNYNNVNDTIESRINRIERQIKNIDSRLKKLESNSISNEEIVDSNLYML